MGRFMLVIDLWCRVGRVICKEGGLLKGIVLCSGVEDIFDDCGRIDLLCMNVINLCFVSWDMR